MFDRIERLLDWTIYKDRNIVYRVLRWLILLGMVIMYMSISSYSDVSLVFLVFTFYVGFFISQISLVILINVFLYHKHIDQLKQMYGGC